MINKLNDDEILDFLMTSDFEGDFKPDELKYLLNKWRYFYRILHGAIERLKVQNDGIIRNLNVKNVKNEDKIEFMKNKKLTWKERFLGKIITKEDENK